MNADTSKVLGRAAQFSFLAGLASGIIYIAIYLIMGGAFGSDAIAGSLFTLAVSFAIAMVFFSGFMLYYSRKN